MIEETAIVTRIGDGQVWVSPQSAGACGGCQQLASCGTAALAKLLPKREFAMNCNQALRVGDKVRVAVDDSHLLLSSLLLYLLPLLPVMLGVGLADAFLPAASYWLPEIGLTLLLLAFWLIHRFQGVLLLRLCLKPRIVGGA